MCSRQVAADVRRRILARKTLPPRYLGGYASILELIGARVRDPQQLHTNQPGWNVRETRRHPKSCGSQSRAPIVTLSTAWGLPALIGPGISTARGVGAPRAVTVSSVNPTSRRLRSFNYPNLRSFPAPHGRSDKNAHPDRQNGWRRPSPRWCIAAANSSNPSSTPI